MTTTHTVETASLSVGYEETGSADGPPVLLLHGWPYSVRSYDGVRGPLAEAGHRVLVPHLRGSGTTRYRSVTTVRSGQQAALGKDVVELLDALDIERAVLVGYDWGGRAACVAAALWPERVRGLVSATGYTINDTRANATQPPDMAGAKTAWYRFFLNHPLGEARITLAREAFARECWSTWSPTWDFTEDELAATTALFHNPDWVPTTLSCYRSWYGGGPVDPALADLEDALAGQPRIDVPTMVLQGDANGIYDVSASAGQESKFGAFYERRVLPGVGHCVPAEDPAATVAGILDLVAASGD